MNGHDLEYQRAAAAKKMRALGAVPTRWELPGGEIWVEETYTEPPLFEVWGCDLATFTHVDGIRTDHAGLEPAVLAVRMKLALAKGSGVADEPETPNEDP